MTFDWMRSQTPADLLLSYPGKGTDRQRREIQQHAGLLYRLGLSKADAVERLKADLRWEFDVHSREAPLMGEIERLVSAVYGRAASASKKASR